MGVKQLKASISCYPEQSAARAASFSKKKLVERRLRSKQNRERNRIKNKSFYKPNIIEEVRVNMKTKIYSETLPYGHLASTVTSLLRPLFLAAWQNCHTFSCVKTLISIRPNFFGPLVNVLTGFHCNCNT